MLEDTKKLILSARWKGLAEVAFYLAPNSSDDFYILYHWWSQADLQSVRKSPSRDFFHHLKSRGELVEVTEFRLVWDYRNLNQITKASTLIIGTLTEEVYRGKTVEDLNYLRQKRHKFPEVIGLWLGRSALKGDEDVKILGRFDFGSLKAQTDFFASEENLQMLKNTQKGYSQIENTTNQMLEVLISADFKDKEEKICPRAGASCK